MKSNKKIVPSSYDIIGSKEKAVAIVEIPDELKNKEKQIAKQIIKRHKNVKTVLKKTSERTSIFRTRNYKYILGDINTEIIHIEHGYKLKLDPKKVYFSGREGTERIRIAEQVKPKENIMLMFAGICPYGIAIAKKQPSVKIIAIEINPNAYEYMKENIRINKISERIIPVLGDVKVKSKDWYGKCNRVIMPLPHDSYKFLNIAYKCLKPKSGYIHMYAIEEEKNVKVNVKKIIDKFQKRINREINFKIRKILPYSPQKNKYCIDLRLS
jgi:tRNA (guanine37-N1)-methyltransferase